MAKVLIKVQVAYVSSLHETFDSQTSIRQQNGGQKYSIAVDEDRHNIVYIFCDWESIQSAKDFWSTPKAKELIEQWKSVDLPEITILRESPED